MNTKMTHRFMILLIVLFGALISVDSIAQKPHNHRDNHREPPKTQNARRTPDRPPADFYRYDSRFRHDRYYPRTGHIFRTLPESRSRIHFHNRDYFFLGGVWYRPHGIEFEVIAPPLGIIVPILPPFYTTVWVGGVPYYYANDVYYVWRPDRNGYQVTKPPQGINDQEPPIVADQLFVYPKEGQSEQQTADDRYQCHVWSRDQTGYDPTDPPENLTAAELNNKRDGYQRALRACLEGRGYSVR